MSADTDATNKGEEAGTAEIAVPALCPYYGSGELLKAKHEGASMLSGRKLETWALALLPLYYQRESAWMPAADGGDSPGRLSSSLGWYRPT